jgi:hypothetical protein
MNDNPEKSLQEELAEIAADIKWLGLRQRRLNEGQKRLLRETAVSFLHKGRMPKAPTINAIRKMRRRLEARD